MKIFVVGSSGRVSTNLIKDLVAEGHEVIAGSRHPENTIKLDHVTPVKFDLHAEVADMAKLIGQVDVIYFTAGSRGKDLLQTDAFGAVKVMQAAEKNQINRFIMLSSLNTLEPEKWTQPDLTNYNIAKFFADNYLINQTNLDYTILQPANLVEQPGTGMITVGDGTSTTNPIPDVAATLAAIIKYPNTSKQVIIMRSGNTAIDTALAKI